jgi:hypothetical protein
MNGDKMYNLRFDAENFKDQKGKIWKKILISLKRTVGTKM